MVQIVGILNLKMTVQARLPPAYPVHGSVCIPEQETLVYRMMRKKGYGERNRILLGHLRKEEWSPYK